LAANAIGADDNVSTEGLAFFGHNLGFPIAVVLMVRGDPLSKVD
jgi:hypothetical protein